MSSTFNYGITSTGLGQLTTTLSSVWRQLAESKEFREEFSALQLKRGVAFQIRALLKKRGWTQSRLAEESKVTQGVVSRAQNPDYGNLTINTINRIAGGFDVAFLGQFVPFSELVDWFENLSEDVGKVDAFEKEYRELLKRKFVRSRTRGRSFRRRVKRNMIMRTKRIPVSVGVRQVRDALPTGTNRTIQQLPLPLMTGSMGAQVIQLPSRPRTEAEYEPLRTAVGGGTYTWPLTPHRSSSS